MNNPMGHTGPPRSSAATHKEKSAVQRSVSVLLNELAPERAPRRGEHVPVPIERHRTPNGCVLQAPECAVSISWFPGESKAVPLGEMHVIVWRGSVARRGATSGRKGATVVSELVLLPVEPSENDCIWRAADGSRYDTAALATKCLELLQQQVDAAG